MSVALGNVFAVVDDNRQIEDAKCVAQGFNDLDADFDFGGRVRRGVWNQVAGLVAVENVADFIPGIGLDIFFDKLELDVAK